MGNQRIRVRKYDRNQVKEDEKRMKAKERMRIQRAKKKLGYNKLMNNNKMISQFMQLQWRKIEVILINYRFS